LRWVCLDTRGPGPQSTASCSWCPLSGVFRVPSISGVASAAATVTPSALFFEPLARAPVEAAGVGLDQGTRPPIEPQPQTATFRLPILDHGSGGNSGRFWRHGLAKQTTAQQSRGWHGLCSRRNPALAGLSEIPCARGHKVCHAVTNCPAEMGLDHWKLDVSEALAAMIEIRVCLYPFHRLAWQCSC
jgi:hypothetical protein